MKKRYTIMLDEKIIKQLKIAASYSKPTIWRETIEKELDEFAFWVIQYYEEKGDDIGTATVKEMREQNEAK